MGRCRLLLPALLTLLTGCSGTPFGDQLARSFSAPPPAAPPPATPTAAQEQLDPSRPGQAQPGQSKPDQAKSGQAKPEQTRSDPTKPLPRQPVAAPAPYRITLRLPGADPAAPAEAVTEALRAAGVRFEVEMIERVRGAEPAGLTTTPAPAPR